jgi:hypothetical protein
MTLRKSMSADPAPRVRANGRTAPAAAATGSLPRRRINWFRFWVQMLVAVLVFNVCAGAITWFFIFPHLHPAR